MIYIFSLFFGGSTFILRERMKMNLVQASVTSSLVGYAVCGVFFFENLNLYSAVIYGASFVGMTTIKNYRYVALVISLVLYSFMFSLYMSWFSGLGGALGFSAFLSVALVSLLSKLKVRFLK